MTAEGLGAPSTSEGLLTALLARFHVLGGVELDLPLRSTMARGADLVPEPRRLPG